MRHLPGMAPEGDVIRGGYCDHRETPRPLFETLSRDFGPFDIDVAASSSNRLCDSYFSMGRSALEEPWGPVCGRPSRCFCNPPYQTRVIGLFARKALAEAMSGRASTVMLCPATKTDQRWWHEYVVGQDGPGATGIWYVVGRIAFWLHGRQPAHSAPDHASVVILWRVGAVSATARRDMHLPTVGSYSQCGGLAAGRQRERVR